MNILDFFCIEKPCSEELQQLKNKYFFEIKKSFYSCSECDTFQIRKKYIKLLYYEMKNLQQKDK